MVSAEMAPLEESLKAMLVDIVRRCQSTVVQNYGRISSPQGGETARMESSSFDPMQTLHPTTQSTSIQDTGPSLLPTTQNRNTQDSGLSLHENSTGRDAEGVRDFFEEPALCNTDMVDNSLDIGSSTLQNPHSDSGYGSSLFFCECPYRSDSYDGMFSRCQYMQEHYLMTTENEQYKQDHDLTNEEKDKNICSSCGLERHYFLY